MNIIQYFRNLLTEKRYVKFGLMLTTGAMGLSIALALTVFAIKQLISLITENFVIVMIVVGAYSLIFIWLKDRTRMKVNKLIQEEEALINSIENAEELFQVEKYELAREILFHTLKDISEILGILMPSKYDDLNSHEKTVKKGKIFINRYVVLKRKPIDPIEVRETVQFRLSQKFYNLDFSGIDQKAYIYEGNPYPLLMVEAVQEHGNQLHIDLVWVNERYCKLLNSRLIARQMDRINDNKIIEDKDFL